jgi:hypothetical protein
LAINFANVDDDSGGASTSGKKDQHYFAFDCRILTLNVRDAEQARKHE